MVTSQQRGCALLALLVLCTVVGCTPVRDFKRGEINVRVEAAAEVRSELDDVEVVLESRRPDANSWRLIEARRFAPDPGRPDDWPLSFQVKGYDAQATYVATATARDGAGAITIQARAISEPAPERRAELLVRFDKECLRPSMLCGRTRTCSFGHCVDAREPLEDAGQATGDPVMQTTHEVEAESDEAAECEDREVGARYCDSQGIMYECQADRVATVKACGENERCVELAADVRCDCLPGFVPDTQGCVEASDCRDQGGCDPLTMCHMQSGQRVCSACPPGYSGTGETGCAPLLSDLEVSPGKLEPAFDPEVTEYSVRVPLLSSRVSLRVQAEVDAELSIDREGASLDEAWTSDVLPVGTTELPITLRARSGARTDYQINVDRSAEQAAYIKPAEPSEWFGAYLAVYEDTLVVGAPNETVDGKSKAGAAYVFVREGDAWRQQARLVSRDPESDDLFGVTVSIWKDRIAVGAPANIFSSIGAAARQGYVLTWRRTGDSWAHEQTVRLSEESSSGNGFGFSAIVREDTLLIGAPLEDTGALNSGAAYVYEWEGASWQQVKRLKASTPQRESHFGTMMAMDADVIAVSAWQEDVNGNTWAGAVYTYRRAPDAWTPLQRVLAPTNRALAMFGAALIVQGELLIVSAAHNPPDTTSNRSGEVHIFERVGDEYRAQQTLEAPQPSVGDRYGNHIGLSESALVVSAPGPGAARSGSDAAGAAYLYARTDEGFVRTASLTPSNPDAEDYFGYSVAITERFVAVAANREDGGAKGINGNAADNTREDSGAVYVFE